MYVCMHACMHACMCECVCVHSNIVDMAMIYVYVRARAGLAGGNLMKKSLVLHALMNIVGLILGTQIRASETKGLCIADTV